MTGKNVKEAPMSLTGYTKKFLQAHPEIKPEAFIALQHEVTEQFPTEPTVPQQKVKPKLVQQLPEGVKAEDYLALRGEQP